jgi:ATP-dependent DNA helicase RecG
MRDPVYSPEELAALLDDLCAQPEEAGWLEFKENNASPEDTGQYISALSNAAALEGKSFAYLVWGVRDGSHEVVGTTFRPAKAKKGNEALQNWLLRLLTPRLDFAFHTFQHRGKPVVVLEIPSANTRPVQFHGTSYIRVGSHRQKLREHPQLEQRLWRTFDKTPFEDQVALDRVDTPGVLSLLDYPSYFDLLEQPLPADRGKILERLQEDRLIRARRGGGWEITNFGAILFARNLDDFRSLARKAARIIVYAGKGRLQTDREKVIRKGYAAGFIDLIEHTRSLLPRTERIGPALRREVPVYPEDAIREIIPNALIHQDFSISGSGPMIEIFPDRMEVTNPGAPLVPSDRFLDSPPRSRNEALAAFMRRIGICEERGTGVDKIVAATERHQLPAPLFEEPDGFTRAVLFAHKPLRKMSRAERSHACYLHACLRHVERENMTNSSLRVRFGISEANKAMASRIIANTIADGLIRAADPNQSRKHATYLPHWA